ncbi:MAG: Tol-Pal system beta propeller repeat protein TolB [Desulfobacterales bacterium]|nr:Tol-Pal system beta propeller repeat protein TolB [Desulfobacterales bacterium]
MKKTYTFLRIFSATLCIWLVIIANGFAQFRNEIRFDEPSARKIPLAVPNFHIVSEKSEDIDLTKNLSQLTEETLNFTGFFKILDHGAFLEEPAKIGIDKTNITFKNWTIIGAELLITGGIVMDSEFLEMELRLFDTVKAEMLIGKRYKGPKSGYREMIRRFCSEIVFFLTGKPGIFQSKIVFVSTIPNQQKRVKEIFICDFDGYAPKQLTSDKNIIISPSLSYDAKWLAYTSYKKGKPDIYIMNILEKRGSIIDIQGTNISPAWVPNRFELAASLSYENDTEIYLLTGDGKIIKRLTKSWDIDVSPSFAPDGKQMAFLSRRSGSPQLYVMNLETEEVRRITFDGKYNTSPCWSPVGDKIIYSGMKDNSLDIYMTDTKGTPPIQLTHNAGDNESPSFSPDGSMIVFSSSREGSSKIYVMNANGTDQRCLLAMPGEQSDPEWSPLLKE